MKPKIPTTRDLIAHPDEDALEKYSLDRLPQEQSDVVGAHLLVCETCMAKVADEDVYNALANRQFKELARETYVPWWAKLRRWYLAALATILALLGWLTSLPVPPVPLQLSAFRGANSANHAQARHPLQLTISAKDIAPSEKYRLQIVDANGSEEWKGPLQEEPGHLFTEAPVRLKPGQYWVRLYSRNTEPLREYDLRLE